MKRIAIRLTLGFVVLFLAINLTPVHAQSAPPVLCGSIIDGFPPGAAGEYFYTVSGIRDPGELWRFMRVTATEATELVAPFALEDVNTVGLPRVSPDGRLMGFAPVLPATTLAVWDMTTDELATVELTPDEAWHLNISYDPFSRTFLRLEWIAGQTLAIRYFDDEVDPRSTRLLRETPFQVSVSPLSIQRGSDVITQFPGLPLPPETAENSSSSIYLSPLGRYAAQISYQFLQYFYNVPRLQVFDLETGAVVFDAVPSEEETVLRNPTWLADESGFFYIAAPPEGYLHLNFAHWVGDGFALDPTFFSTISQAIGGEAQLATSLLPTLNPTGDGIGFLVLIDREEVTDRYIAAYIPHEGRLALVCSPIRYEQTDLLYPFWSPDGRYFGFWNVVGTIALDLQTGDVYRLPDVGREWVGWVGGGAMPSTP
ncbi:MAG: hypothetical protein KJ065_27875 [Anaerolineae bacterium]|nr:hypothetical protein [Anaerolineae bacterium]